MGIDIYTAGLMPVCNQAEQNDEPKTTIDKVAKALNKNRQYDYQSEMYKRFSDLEREAGTAIRAMSEEIDALNERVKNLEQKATFVTFTK